MLIDLDEALFEEKVLQSSSYVLVDFWAPWCHACKQLETVLEILEEDYIDTLKIYKLNVETYMDLADRYDVMNLPSLLLFKDGKVVKSIFGMQSIQKLKECLSL